LNDPDTPTSLPKSGAPTSPDVTLASAHVALASTWVTNVKLNSDHLPITITLPSDEVSPPRTAKLYTNFRKADWPAFIRECEAVFRGLEMPTSCGAGEKTYRRVLLTAAKHAIPAGYRRDCTPGISREAADLIVERDNLRAPDPVDPNIGLLNHDISCIIAENRQNLWRDKVHSAGSRPDPSKCWSLLRGLSGKKTFVSPNQPISFRSSSFSNPNLISEQFIRQYVPRPKSDPQTRHVLRQLHRAHPLDNNFSPFTLALTEEAILRSSNSTATGPDGLTALHLKHLGPAGLVTLQNYSTYLLGMP
jgi:hypothetical protein